MKTIAHIPLACIALMISALVALVMSCSENGPKLATAPTNDAASLATPSPSLQDTRDTDHEPILTQCQTLAITARRVLSVSTSSVVLRVLADYSGPGDVQVKIIDRESGRLIGNFALGDITFTGLSQGHYKWWVFVEVYGTNGEIIQCDGGIEFDIPNLSPPPPSDCEGIDCVPPSPPGCNQTFNGEDCEPPLPPACNVNIGNYSLGQPLGSPSEECRITGDGVPGPPNNWWVMKCGLDYTVSITKLDHCNNSNHDLSHATGCACE